MVIDGLAAHPGASRSVHCHALSHFQVVVSGLCESQLTTLPEYPGGVGRSCYLAVNRLRRERH